MNVASDKPLNTVFDWTMTISVNHEEKVMSARVDARHRFGNSETANKFANKICEIIGASISPDELNTMTLEKAENDGTYEQQ